MATILDAQHPSVVTLDEFIDYVNTSIDVRDIDSLCSAGAKLRGLANDRDLVVRKLNHHVKAEFTGETSGSTQSFFLGEGREFYVRANIWPSSADYASGRVMQETFSYEIAHDHNFDFLTVGYYGPGYQTDLFEYDNAKVEGYVGEPVELLFRQRVHFRTGMVMLYEAHKDVHTQFPPDDLSMTLNLMVLTPEMRLRDQYHFDVERQLLVDYPAEAYCSKRVSVVRLAAHFGDQNTLQLLHDLSRKHPCRRTRLAAFETLAQLDPASRTEIWEIACRDRETLVTAAARKALPD